ncbi:MAG: poly(3-hydroxyalkanoate) depolymerase [Acidimicrobiales bacterium]
MTEQASTHAQARPADQGGTGAVFLEVSGIRLRVRVTGSGPPLLLVMGIGGNLDMWEPLIPQLGGRQIIVFDAPGTGGSGSSRMPLAMGQHARILAKLLDRLGFPRVDVLGVSWGGLLAQKLAIDHPRRVRRLILAATLPGVGGVPGGPSAMRTLMSPRRYYSRDLFTQVAPGLYGGRARTHPESVSVDLQHRLARPPSPAGYLAQIAATWTYSGYLQLRRVRAPTLIMAGDDDPIVPVVNARILARLVPDSSVHIVPGGGHLFLMDGTPDVGEIITDFLDAPRSVHAPQPRC